MGKIESIARDFLDDAISLAVDYGMKYPSWEAFLDMSFEPCFDDGAIPGFSTDKKATAALAEDKEFAQKCLPLYEEQTSDSCLFLVACVRESANGLEKSFAKKFSRIKG